jgi:2-dehydropantoate 2-reductase
MAAAGSPLRVAVLGAGAIGAFVGAALARGGADVTLIARGDHLLALRESGVQVHSPRGDFHAHPPATDDLDAVAGADVVFLGLKAYSLPEVAPRLGLALDGATAVIAAQNGVPWWFPHGAGEPLADRTLESVDPDGAVSRAIAPARAIGCVVYCSAELVAPGVVRHIEGTRFALGEPDGSQTERCRVIAAAFAAGGLKAPVEARLREQLWLKLVGNVAFNPVSALTGATLGELGGTAAMRELLLAVMQEVAAVGECLGLSLPVSLARRLEAGLEVGDHRTSMLQDLQSGKPLEHACMTGAVIELADLCGVRVPATRAVHACIDLLDRRRATTPVA